MALDPSDATGNTLYVGTTGGGVWAAQNAATTNPAAIAFSRSSFDNPAYVGDQEGARFSTVR